jgi:hypothetical protein
MNGALPEKIRHPVLPAGWLGARGVHLIAVVGVLIVGAQWVHDWGPDIMTLGARNPFVAVDYHILIDATRRFLSGGPFYDPRQLSGAYDWDGSIQGWWPVLYPPQAIALFAPFTMLPPILWWAIPLVTVVATVAWHRPTPLVWPLLALCMWWPATTIKIVTGNPVIWAAAAVALGTIWRWPAALALVKPSLFPLALIGVRDRRWWLLAGAGALPFAWMLPEYLRALGNFQSGPGYSIQEVPLLLIPILAWVGSTRVGPRPVLPFRAWWRAARFKPPIRPAPGRAPRPVGAAERPGPG